MGNLNTNIRVEMVRRGLLQRDLATLSGITQATISRRLTGDENDWTFGELVAVAAALDIPLSTLLPEAAVA